MRQGTTVWLSAFGASAGLVNPVMRRQVIALHHRLSEPRTQFWRGLTLAGIRSVSRPWSPCRFPPLLISRYYTWHSCGIPYIRRVETPASTIWLALQGRGFFLPAGQPVRSRGWSHARNIGKLPVRNS